MTAHIEQQELEQHAAADDLRTIATLVDDGLPIPVAVTPRFAGPVFPTRIQVSAADVEPWREALDLPPMTWAVKGAVSQEIGSTESPAFHLIACRLIELRVAQ